MSGRVKKYKQQLRLLHDASPKIRKSLIVGCRPQMLSCICECAVNILKGNVPLTSGQKKKLCRHKHSLRLLSNKKVAIKSKKKLLQTGGFLGALLTPILSLLGGLLGRNGTG